MPDNDLTIQAEILELAKLVVQEKSSLLDLLKDLDDATASSPLPLAGDLVPVSEIEVVTIQNVPAQGPKG